MYKLGILCCCLLCLWACSTENSLQLSNSPKALKLLPTVGSSGVRYFSTTGDTITITKSTQYNRYTESVPLNGNIGGNTNLEKVVLESTYLILACDSPNFRFTFSLEAQQDLNSQRGSIDALSLSWENNGVQSNSHLSLAVSDTVLCADAQCQYADTLSLSGVKTYTQVFYTDRNASQSRLFLSESNGLIAFTTQDQVTFERIP